MYRNCTTEDSVRRQRQFELLLLDAMASKSYSQITIGELCQTVGISRSAFYRYFDSKEDILYALIDHTLMDYYQTQLDCPLKLESYRDEIAPFLEYWQNQKTLLDVIQKNELDGVFLQRCMKHTMGRPLDERFDPLLGTESRYQVTLFAITGLFTLILDWHHNGYHQSISQMSEMMERIMLKPLVIPIVD